MLKLRGNPKASFLALLSPALADERRGTGPEWKEVVQVDGVPGIRTMSPHFFRATNLSRNSAQVISAGLAPAGGLSARSRTHGVTPPTGARHMPRLGSAVDCSITAALRP